MAISMYSKIKGWKFPARILVVLFVVILAGCGGEKEAGDKVFIWLQRLREAGIRCDMEYRSVGLKAQMRRPVPHAAGLRTGARRAT